MLSIVILQYEKLLNGPIPTPGHPVGYDGKHHITLVNIHGGVVFVAYVALILS